MNIMAEKKIYNFRNPGKTRHTEANVDSTLVLGEGLAAFAAGEPVVDTSKTILKEKEKSVFSLAEENTGAIPKQAKVSTHFKETDISETPGKQSETSGKLDGSLDECVRLRKQVEALKAQLELNKIDEELRNSRQVDDSGNVGGPRRDGPGTASILEPSVDSQLGRNVQQEGGSQSSGLPQNIADTGRNFGNQGPWIMEPRVRLPVYDGKGDWEPFWVQFQFLTSEYGWDSSRKLSTRDSNGLCCTVAC